MQGGIRKICLGLGGLSLILPVALFAAYYGSLPEGEPIALAIWPAAWMASILLSLILSMSLAMQKSLPDN